MNEETTKQFKEIMNHMANRTNDAIKNGGEPIQIIQHESLLQLFRLLLKRVDEVEAKLDRVLLKE